MLLILDHIIVKSKPIIVLMSMSFSHSIWMDSEILNTISASNYVV